MGGRTARRAKERRRIKTAMCTPNGRRRRLPHHGGFVRVTFFDILFIIVGRFTFGRSVARSLDAQK